MAYISETDLNLYVTEDQLERFKRIDESTGIDYLTKAIEESENYVKRRLNYKYDMDTELAKTGSDRDQTLIRIICVIALYNLSIPFELHDEAGKYYEQYQRALDDVMKMENGTLLSDVLTFRDEDNQQILYGKSDNTELKY